MKNNSITTSKSLFGIFNVTQQTFLAINTSNEESEFLKTVGFTFELLESSEISIPWMVEEESVAITASKHSEETLTSNFKTPENPFLNEVLEVREIVLTFKV